MRSQALQVFERCFFPIDKARLWKVLPVSSMCPGSMTVLAFHGSGWSFSAWLLLNGGVCRKGWGTEAAARDHAHLKPSVLKSVG